MRPSPIRPCPECGVIDPALILGVLTGRLSQLDRLFYQASRPPDPWLARGPSSGAIFRSDGGNPPTSGSCHTRLFKLSGYRPPCALSESFFWRARAAQDILRSAPPRAEASYARAEASRLWVELLCIDDAPGDGASAERSKRIARIDEVAAVAGLSPILFHLREFLPDINRAALLSPTPGKTLDSFLNPPREARGRPKRDWKESVEIAAAVERLRRDSLVVSVGMTVDDACEEVARARRLQSGRAVRKIYEEGMNTKAKKALVRLVAGLKVEL